MSKLAVNGITVEHISSLELSYVCPPEDGKDYRVTLGVRKVGISVRVGYEEVDSARVHWYRVAVPFEVWDSLVAFAADGRAKLEGK